jgi:hypothetical protein
MIHAAHGLPGLTFEDEISFRHRYMCTLHRLAYPRLPFIVLAPLKERFLLLGQ